MQCSRAPRVRNSQASLVGCLLLLLAATPALSQLAGTMSNFDAVNTVGDPAGVTNLELDLRLIQPMDVVGFYHGQQAWGIPPIVRDIGGSEVVWADFRRPLWPQEMRHFGLRLAPDAPVPCNVQAFWTRHVKVAELPVPWQTWRTQPGMVLDLIRLSPETAENLLLRREFAILPFRVPLEELNWDNPTIPWQPVAGDPVFLEPGGMVELPLPVAPFDQAVLVRYTVALARNPENILTRFVNEAEIEALMPVPLIVGSLSNFDALNDTGKPVHDLELDIRRILPGDILDWYRGPNSWGLHPVTRDPSIVAIPDYGTQVTWVDEWNPLPHGQIRHFGLRLNPEAPEPLVRAYWTRVVKVHQLPFPWQWWQTAPGRVIRDVIQLSDTYPQPVTVLREWATTPFPVPLDDLVWDNPGILWLPDPAGPVTLRPGDQTELDIRPDYPAGAALVRYTVTGPDGLTEVRFVNEAEFGPSPSPQQIQITGTLSNFDAVNLTRDPVTNLELDFRLIQPWQILDWYRGPLAWGLHPLLQAPALFALPQTEVAWTAFREPLFPGETRHFGLELTPDAPAPCGVNASWTQHRKIFEIPVPWQTWRVPPIDPPQVFDVVRLNPEFPEPVMIRREFATLGFRIPLPELNWDNPAIPWIPVLGDPVTLPPGGEVELPIPVTPMDQAVVVRYTVVPAANPGEIITRFVNEAELEFGPLLQIPVITGSLSNFDAVNTTGKPVHDLELDILNISPLDIWDWYRGPDAWGIDPVIRPLPGGAEVTWIDDRNPMNHGDRRHFGLQLNPGTPEPLVRAFWTREVKVRQIPIPWQFWVLPPGPFVRDVVQLSDLYPDQVWIRREYALAETPVPLDLLNWDLAANWQPDPAGPILLDPGDQADLDIPVNPDDAAVLVRYAVSIPTDAPVVRFVNQAIRGPGVVSGLRFKPDKTTVTWNASLVTGTVFDIARGALTDLRATGGIHLAQCAPGGDNLPFPVYLAGEFPSPGDGFYFVVRAQFGLQHSTYDTTTDPLRREGRDLEIGPGDCP